MATFSFTINNHSCWLEIHEMNWPGIEYELSLLTPVIPTQPRTPLTCPQNQTCNLRMFGFQIVPSEK